MIAIQMRDHQDTEFGLQTSFLCGINIPDFSRLLARRRYLKKADKTAVVFTC